MQGGAHVDSHVAADCTTVDPVEPAFDVAARLCAKQVFEAVAIEDRGLALLAQAFDHLPLARKVFDRAPDILELEMQFLGVTGDAFPQIGVADLADLLAEERKKLLRLGLTA